MTDVTTVPATATHVRFDVEDDPEPEVCSLADALVVNADDEETVEALRSLKVGEVVVFGGGAQPLVTITGLASAEPA